MDPAEGRKFHRGKLSETTNDKVIAGFPMSELPVVPGGNVVAGPRCFHTPTGQECSLPTPEEVKRDTENFYTPHLAVPVKDRPGPSGTIAGVIGNGEDTLGTTSSTSSTSSTSVP